MRLLEILPVTVWRAGFNFFLWVKYMPLINIFVPDHLEAEIREASNGTESRGGNILDIYIRPVRPDYSGKLPPRGDCENDCSGSAEIDTILDGT